MKTFVLLAAVSFLSTPGARAAIDKSGYHLFRPVPRALMRELKTDRPDRTESPFTVDAGHLQIEADFITFSRDHDEDAGETTKKLSFLPANFKLGLTSAIDLQVILNPQEVETTAEGAAKERANGYGDTTLRLKWNFLGDDEGDVALALLPFVKFPTANRELGRSEKVDGGIIFPIELKLPHEIGLDMELEINRAADEEGGGRHQEFISSISVSHKILGELEGYAEFYSEASSQRETGWKATADAGLTYGLTPDLQLDGGANVGVTAAADDINIFSGITARF